MAETPLGTILERGWRRKALTSAFITAGDPVRWVTPRAMQWGLGGRAYGADSLIEILGNIFSDLAYKGRHDNDPESDGPAIEKAASHRRALSGSSFVFRQLQARTEATT